MSMQLKRLRLESFRRFRQPLEIHDLDAGLNLFAAPNEAGKSTVVEAIRAAFLERHRSTVVGHLRPWDDPSATPLVEVDFELDGREFRLAKAFVGKKRCSLVVDGRALDGAQAEDYLAELLGFRYARRGASSDEDMGVPGLLWIRQGEAQDFADGVRHAGQHLRDALGASLGELSASDGDVILAQVREARHALLHATAGTPKGDYAKAVALQTETEAEVAALTQRIALYRDDVDRLARLRADHAAAEASRPWEDLAQRREQAQRQLQQVDGLAEELRLAQQTLRQREAHVAAQQVRVEQIALTDQDASKRRGVLQALQARVDEAREDVVRHEARVADAAAARVRTRAAVEQARQAGRRKQAEQAVTLAQRSLETLAQRLGLARTAHEQWQRLDIAARALKRAPDALPGLRRLDQALGKVEARLAAAATSVNFDLLPQVQLQVGESLVNGRGSVTLTRPAALDLPGLGRIEIVPGGAGLDALVAERDQLRQSLAHALRDSGAVDVADAERQARDFAQWQTQAEAERRVLHSHAPQGLAALEQELAAVREDLAAAQQALAEMPAAADGAAVLDLEVAESQDGHAQRAQEAATAAWSQARVAVGIAEAEASSAQVELRRVLDIVEAAGWAGQRQQAMLDLTEARTGAAQAQSAVTRLDEALRSANPALLRQDVQRLLDSERNQHRQHQERDRQITELRSRLETVGSGGLEEELAAQTLVLAAARRRVADLARRSQALDHLLRLLEEKRSQLMRRLHAPLQKHLDHYLRILFPGASVELSEDLVPGRITRRGANGSENGGVDELSFGAREQVGVLARLAYADLLREAGRPALIMLDDALVHADNARLGQMKRVLYDAAQRHQILIFTCHPEAWSDLGVAPRALT